MLAKVILPALAALQLASAQSSTASQCSQSTATINSPADATNLAGNCQTVSGSILISPDAAGQIDLSGIKQIKGDLIVANNSGVSTLSSSNTNAIGGLFNITIATKLTSITMESMRTVGGLSWVNVPNLVSVDFGQPGITSAGDIEVSDTFLSDLKGLVPSTIGTLDINNNGQLVSFSSTINNITNVLNFLANGQNFAVSLPNLVFVANMTVSNVSSFAVPALNTVNGSMSFTGNSFSSFAAPNLTQTQSGDVSFVSNAGLANVSLPNLSNIGGGLLFAANPKLGNISLPSLQNIGGAVKLSGAFSSVSMPQLSNVKGAFNATSTGDISSSCNSFSQLSSANKIQGSFDCVSNNTAATNDTSGLGSDGGSGGSGGSGSSGSGSSGSGNKGNAGAVSGVNSALLSLTLIGALVSMLL